MPIRVALIGLGYWGTNLARVIEESTKLKLVCCADTDPHRGNCTVDDLLARGDVQAVIIATPATTHADLVERSLMANKHVLVEKPLAISYDDAEYLVDMAEERKLQLMIDHTYVYSPGLAAVRGALVGLGEITSISSTRTHRGGPKDVNALWDLLPHDLSIVQALAPQWWDSDPAVQHIGDNEEGMVWFGWGKQRCAVEYSRVRAEKIRRVSVATGCGARVRWLDFPVPRVFIERPDHDGVEEVNVMPGEALANVVRAFAAAIEFGKPAPSSGRSSLRLIEAIERANDEAEAK